MGNFNKHSLLKSITITFLVFFSTAVYSQPTEGYPAEVWKNLDQTVGNASVVSFGESSHRLVELHKFANDMFRYLAEKKGFRVYVLETMWEVEGVFNEFVKSGKPELDMKEQFYLNAFRSSYTLELFKWARDWKLKHPNDPIIISGYQPEQPVSDAREIKSILTKASINFPDSTAALLQTFAFYNGQFQHDLDAVSYFGKKRRAKLPLLRTTERDSLRKAIEGMLLFVEKEKESLSQKLGTNPYLELKAHILSIKGYYFGIAYHADPTNSPPNCGDALKNGESAVRNIYSEGDNFRSQIFNILRQTRFKGKKIFVWQHAWHAAKYSYLLGETDYQEVPVRGTVSWGTYMNPTLGKDYVVVGSIVPCDNCSYQLPVFQPNLTKLFGEVLGGKTILINLKKPSPQLAGQLPLNTNGCLYVQEGAAYITNLNLSQQFDAIFYVPRSKDVR